MIITNFLLKFVEKSRQNFQLRQLSTNTINVKDPSPTQQVYKFPEGFTNEQCQQIIDNMTIYDNFLSKTDEQSLLNEVEPHLKRLPYEFNHWDDAIHGYRESERLQWNVENQKIIGRVKNLAFAGNQKPLSLVHVLDLADNGYIKPHIDSVRFCGDTIAGLSLLSDAVMRLVHEKQTDMIVDVLLKRGSLYIMRNYVRFEFTHEILKKEESTFDGKSINRQRRISVICRNEPKST